VLQLRLHSGSTTSLRSVACNESQNQSKFLKTSAPQMKSKSRRQKRPFVRIRPIKISDFEFVRSLASKTKGYTVCPPYILREYLARQQTSTPLSERQGTQTPSLAPRAPPSRLKPGRKRKVFVVCSVNGNWGQVISTKDNSAPYVVITHSITSTWLLKIQ
jgi:hypothetical protein